MLFFLMTILCVYYALFILLLEIPLLSSTGMFFLAEMASSMKSPSPTSIKAGNVLALLNTLYSSGFAMASPGLPLLKDRTMHTLYAISFIVYSLNCGADWLHVYFTLRPAGRVTSFPLETWLVVLLVVTVVSGSMLTGLLLMLCIENAFAHRLDVKPYRSGFAIIVEAIVEWIQAFNNFRVAFLVMILHDTPMTIINFFFIASCRCAGPQIIPWSLLLSSATTNISVLWRLTMLYFTYKRMICPMTKAPPTPGVFHFPTPAEHLQTAVNTSDEARMHQYDETWPIRWARRTIYGADLPSTETSQQSESSEKSKRFKHNGCARGIRNPILYSACRPFRLFACVSLTLLGYLSFLLSCCFPCCFHYCCTRDSFRHRHAFARSFVRYMSYLFHYSVCFLSAGLCVLLLTFNILLLSSVHILGSNSLPPEINEVCVATNTITRSISISLSSAKIFGRRSPPSGYELTVCKPIWEDGGLGLGLKRTYAGPWQTRQQLSDSILLAISTQVVINGSDSEHPFLLLRFDRAILTKIGRVEFEDRYSCGRGKRSNWTIELPTESPPLSFPYFIGCDQDWRFEESRLIECEDVEWPPTAAPPPWLHYPAGAGAFYPLLNQRASVPRRRPPPVDEDIDRGDLRKVVYPPRKNVQRFLRKRRRREHFSRSHIAL